MEDKEKEMQLKVEIFKGLCHYYHDKPFALTGVDLASKANYAYECMLKNIKNS